MPIDLHQSAVDTLSTQEVDAVKPIGEGVEPDTDTIEEPEGGGGSP